ncbi:MAG: ATP-binding cassette domain-containing protein [Lachnospiraceae bacterium]|jgi:oligopeptide transport system ATP-binding protein|nr:ATP-binding cassette domain-containing protein [uncultured Acetatifactor sp.]MCI9220018.1 ATP-binding cassette domain-containing protein [Lachnospiraceae bacterium]
MTNQNQELLLRVEHLCQYFKAGNFVTKAVDDVSFDIRKGEVFGLVGESGCGKTTTGRSIIGLYNITSGNIYFKGIRIAAGVQSYRDELKKTKDPARISELKALIKTAQKEKKNCDREYAAKRREELEAEYGPKIKAASGEEKARLEARYKDELRKAGKSRLVTRIQMIFQDPIASLDPRMTVREIISEGLVIQGERDKKVIDEKVYEMLELVGLVREHASRYPHEFSGGQRQRIGVARSIIMNPELIIADEPVSALDVSVQAQVINLLNELRERLGLTILFIAHDLSVVKYFSDRIGVMYYGKMVELADSDELFAHPLHPYTRSLLSAIPLPDPVYERQRRRITYNPLAEHDYTVDQPSFREVRPGHFVQCNEAEYQKILAELSAK